LLENLQNIFEYGLDFIGGISQAPGAGKVIIITTAGFAGKNVEDNGLSQTEQVIWVTAL
jgi:hypothetical protein